MLSRVGFNKVLPKTILHLTQAGGKITEKLFKEIVDISKKMVLNFIRCMVKQKQHQECQF